MLSPLAVSFLEPNIDGGQLADILLTSSRDFLLSLSFFLSFFLRIVPSDISFLSSKNIEIEMKLSMRE